MTNVARKVFRIVLVALLCAASGIVAAASTYYVRVTGVPSTISCTNTGFTFGSGATLAWNFQSVSSIVDYTLSINGGVITSGSAALGAITSSASGSNDLSILNTFISPYPSTPFPYTVQYDVAPRDANTDGVSVSFTCNASGGTGFVATVIPPQTPVIAFTPASLNFAATSVGTTSAASTVTIANTGTADATGVTVASSNATEFVAGATTCTAVIAKNTSCTVDVAFKPAASGQRSANLSVSHDGGSASMSMKGTGVGQLTVSQVLPFASVTVGTTSAPQTLTVTNTGATTVTVSSLVNSNAAEFPVTTNCATINAGAICTIDVAFKPSGTGLRSGLLTLNSDGVGSPQTINLNGNGVAASGPGQLSLPATLVFAAQAVGTTSAASNVTVTNTGGAAVTVASIVSSAPSEFGVTAPGCATVNPGSSCTISVTFAPVATGSRTATITVTSSGTGSPQAIAVSGTGAASAPPGQLSVPSGLGFGDQAVGTTSPPTLMVLTNVGGTSVTVASIVSSAPNEFAMPGASCAPLNPGAPCQLSVTFTPAAAGVRSATITITSNGIGSPQVINLTGTGIGAAPPMGQLSMNTELVFGDVQVGMGTTATAYLTNVGAAPVTINGIELDNPLEFSLAQWDCAIVPVQETCSFRLTFTPIAVGARTGAIAFTSNGVGSPQAISLAGTGTATPPPPPPTVDVIEYYHAEWDHYFMTAIKDEITKLDNGEFKGWARTGHKFKAYAPNTAGSANVCRFFSTAFAPRSSHFYTPFADECADVKKKPEWMLESEAVFSIPIPDIHGVCPEGTVAVYRYYNQGQGGAPNHRYATEFSLRDEMILVRGWIPEGYGDFGVIMCAPN